MDRKLHGNALVIHGGGPTPVLNASLAGVIWAARKFPDIEGLLGARHGVEGVLREDFYDLFAQPQSIVEALKQSPGSAIGSSRKHMRDEDYEHLHRVLVRRQVHFVFVTGGNGTQETGLRIQRMAEDLGYGLRVVGIPKTVDNDLGCTEFSPGYPSAARFYAQAIRDIGEDNRSLPTPINVTEVIGRNTGWVVGATVLARAREEDAPHLIYLPERRISEDTLCADVESVYRRLGRCVVAICEGQRNTRDEPFGAESHAAPGSRDRLASNLGHQVAGILTQRLGVRARSEKPGLLGRSSAVDVPAVDREAAFGCGAAAVEFAMKGEQGVMVVIDGTDAISKELHYATATLERVAMTERRVPLDWIAPEGNDVTQTFRKYAAALAGDIAAYPRLVRETASLERSAG